MEFFNEFRKLSAKLKKGIVADDVPIIKDKLAELEEMPLSDEERKFLGILRQELDEAVAGLPQEKKECSLSCLQSPFPEQSLCSVVSSLLLDTPSM